MVAVAPVCIRCWLRRVLLTVMLLLVVVLVVSVFECVYGFDDVWFTVCLI